jgi:hypothetical protein
MRYLFDHAIEIRRTILILGDLGVLFQSLTGVLHHQLVKEVVVVRFKVLLVLDVDLFIVYIIKSIYGLDF